MGEERHKVHCRNNYQENKDDYYARTKSWRIAHPEEYKAIQRRARDKRFREKWWQELNRHTHSTASQKRLGPSEMSEEFIKLLFDKQKGFCYWLGIPLVPSDKRRDPRRPSLDRLDTAYGYRRDNVVLACQFANLGRNTLDAESFRLFVEEMRIIFRS